MPIFLFYYYYFYISHYKTLCGSSTCILFPTLEKGQMGVPEQRPFSELPIIILSERTQNTAFVVSAFVLLHTRLRAPSIPSIHAVAFFFLFVFFNTIFWHTHTSGSPGGQCLSHIAKKKRYYYIVPLKSWRLFSRRDAREVRGVFFSTHSLGEPRESRNDLLMFPRLQIHRPPAVHLSL